MALKRTADYSAVSCVPLTAEHPGALGSLNVQECVSRHRQAALIDNEHDPSQGPSARNYWTPKTTERPVLFAHVDNWALLSPASTIFRYYDRLYAVEPATPNHITAFAHLLLEEEWYPQVRTEKADIVREAMRWLKSYFRDALELWREIYQQVYLRQRQELSPYATATSRQDWLVFVGVDSVRAGPRNRKSVVERRSLNENATEPVFSTADYLVHAPSR